ncbi:MAG: Lrp/AsnC family transcriptional regulator [Methylomonas sp.]|nr:Lrp/AsnC family transcriptional regulator [Methylomonas sp.]PPD21675.1 MAG: AsnC family protein [Methylomonas sp.]PPD25945.1 MAG: AsnC family protein [Methylomonas sp.]PPD37681.1 MAG: AsnC family protein [Methylomonas sp.]PPD39287.1 MAG: AsnC family protein [Methylomonas sp.]
MLTSLQKRLLNDYQQAFPLSSRPFRDIAEQLGVAEHDVLTALRELSDRQMISRIGPVIAPNLIGSSSLVAMAIPDDDLERVAGLVSRYAEINHNYERENRFNLWFVAVGDNDEHLQSVITDIERQTGYPAMRLPMLADYFINLGFDLNLP